MMACDPNANTCGTGCVDGSDDLAAYYENYYASSNDYTSGKRGGGTDGVYTISYTDNSIEVVEFGLIRLAI